MNSEQLSVEGFHDWVPFSADAEGRVLEQMPLERGVFVVRRTTPCNRSRGASDLIYIGVGANQQGDLRMRIQQIYHPGHNQTLNQRLNDLMESNDFQLGFAITPDREEAEALKRRLLERYRDEH